MQRAIAAARRLGHQAVLLVGDAPYYGRFGFSAEKTGALGCPARSRGIACSAANWCRARSMARAGSSPRPGVQRRAPSLDSLRAASAPVRPRATPPDATRIALGAMSMNAMAQVTRAWPQHARFDGPIVMIGFGSIGKGTLPLHRASHRIRSQEIRGDRAGGRGSSAARRPPAPFHPHRDHQGELPRRADPAPHRRAGPRHDRQPFGRYQFGRADRVRQGSRRLLHRHRGRAMARALHRPHLSISARSNYALREGVLELRRRRPGGITAVSCCGANPGMVSWFVKQALLDVAAESGLRSRSRRRARTGRG